MNKNLKIALGIAVGVGLIYFGYKYLYKKGDSKEKGSDTLQEEIVHDKKSRKVILIPNI
jgi:uncharacterized membrane protein